MIPKTMPAVVFDQPGGPENLQLRQIEVPEPGPGQVLIEVRLSGVNRPDLLQRQGKYPPPADASPRLGLEVSGKIVSLGPQISLDHPITQIGASVAALVPGGGYAKYCVTWADHCLPVTGNQLSLIDAGLLPETLFTVWHNVFERGRLKAGETILIHGGSSGIGTTAIQMAKAHGARVFVTVKNELKAQACLRLGADRAILYPDSPFEKEVLQWTQGRGVDLILDMVGGPYIERGLGCLTEEGRIVLIATQGGQEAKVSLVHFLRKRATLTGSALRPRSIEAKSDMARGLLKTFWPQYLSGQLRPVVDRIFNAHSAECLEEIRESHRYLEKGDVIGKVGLRWTQ